MTQVAQAVPCAASYSTTQNSVCGSGADGVTIFQLMHDTANDFDTVTQEAYNLLGLSNDNVPFKNFLVVPSNATAFNTFPTTTTEYNFNLKFNDIWYNNIDCTGMMICKMVAITYLSAAPTLAPTLLLVGLMSSLSVFLLFRKDHCLIQQVKENNEKE